MARKEVAHGKEQSREQEGPAPAARRAEVPRMRQCPRPRTELPEVCTLVPDPPGERSINRGSSLVPSPFPTNLCLLILWKIKAGWMIKVEKEVTWMSFRCQGECGRHQLPGSSPVKVVTQKRRVVYQKIEPQHGAVVRKSHGTETVQEADMCRSCAAVAPPPSTTPGTPKYVVTMIAAR
jgi:hypothetical protein